MLYNFFKDNICLININIDVKLYQLQIATNDNL